MGGIMTLLFFLRFFVFHLYETPKFLMSRGRDAEAVEVVRAVARFNGKESSLTLDMLTRCDELSKKAVDSSVPIPANGTSARAALWRTMSTFNGNHVKALFATPKVALTTTLLIVIWGERVSYNLSTGAFLNIRMAIVAALIGLAFPL